MAALLTKTSWGYSITCTGGTAVAAQLVAPGTRLKIAGIACGGAATTDITTVNDGNAVLVFTGAAAVNTMNSLPLAKAINVDGLQVGFAGATTCYVNVYLTE